ncbi:MAG: hypothetical protein H6558_07850 [Lewinellaceae bacterium]|nr:hypothetical protein [Lewinellaceae bacterium]MCB9291047.1 hypothetical protein [Lewinellaceae bacterium]
MKTLLELVRIVTKNRIRRIELLGKANDNENKLMNLYDALSTGAARTDKEAMEFLYGPGGKYSSYRSLKSILKKRLLNSLLFINLSDTSLNDQERAYYRCHKDWAAVRVLLRMGGRQAAIRLAEKALRRARRFDLTEISVQASQVLRFHYGARLGNLKKMEEYNRIHKRYARAWRFESLAEEYYTLLVASYISERAAKADANKIALAYYEELKGAMAEYQTYRLLFLGHLIRIIAYRSVNDYKRTVESCQEAIRAFEAKDYEVKTPIYTFLHQQILAHIQLRQFEKGEDTARKAAQLIPAGTVNWFVNMEMLLILSLHTRQYQRALEVFQQATSHKGYERLREVDKEQWRINGAYIHFLLEAGRASAGEDQVRLRKFRLARFLNEVPVFSRDKQGMNVAILIIQTLFLIIKKRYGEAIDRIDAINKYRVRYLVKDKALKRSNFFVKMLLQIPLCSFHKEAVIRKSEQYYNKLKAIPLEVANQTHGIEIIPYEDLWAFVLETLEPRFYKGRR